MRWAIPVNQTKKNSKLNDMKKIILCFMLLCVTLKGLAAKVDKIVNITVNGEERSYLLYVPTNVKSNAPLVVSLHGAGNSMTTKHPMGTDVADSEGFIVVYPQGKLIYFPVFGGSVNGWDASGEVNEDVEFIKAIIDDVAKNYSIDRKRIYCCGFSNGGMMTYAMTNAAADVFAAFSSISGFPLNEFHFRHTGARPVPFLHIHGKSDDFVKYSCMPIIVDEMVARVGASPVPVKTTVSGMYDKSVYEAGEGGFPFVYYEINGMGHNDYTGNTEDGSSSKTMWNFMKQYTLDTPCDATLKWRPALETEGYTPKDHGWLSSTSKMLFGRDQHKADNSDNNVYRSFQLTTGNYKLCFHTQGEEGKTVTVQIRKLTGSKPYVLNETVPVGGEKTLLFSVEDGWGEYSFTVTRPAVDAVSNFVLYSASDEEMTSVESPRVKTVAQNVSDDIFDLAGRKVAEADLRSGVYLQKGKKLMVR